MTTFRVLTHVAGSHVVEADYFEIEDGVLLLFSRGTAVGRRVAAFQGGSWSSVVAFPDDLDKVAE